MTAGAHTVLEFLEKVLLGSPLVQNQFGKAVALITELVPVIPPPKLLAMSSHISSGGGSVEDDVGTLLRILDIMNMPRIELKDLEGQAAKLHRPKGGISTHMKLWRGQSSLDDSRAGDGALLGGFLGQLSAWGLWSASRFLDVDDPQCYEPQNAAAVVATAIGAVCIGTLAWYGSDRWTLQKALGEEGARAAAETLLLDTSPLGTTATAITVVALEELDKMMDGDRSLGVIDVYKRAPTDANARQQHQKRVDTFVVLFSLLLAWKNELKEKSRKETDAKKSYRDIQATLKWINGVPALKAQLVYLKSIKFDTQVLETECLNPLQQGSLYAVPFKQRQSLSIILKCAENLRSTLNDMVDSVLFRL